MTIDIEDDVNLVERETIDDSSPNENFELNEDSAPIDLDDESVDNNEDAFIDIDDFAYSGNLVSSVMIYEYTGVF